MLEASVTKPAKLRGVYYVSYDTFASHSGTQPDKLLTMPN